MPTEQTQRKVKEGENKRAEINEVENKEAVKRLHKGTAVPS